MTFDSSPVGIIFRISSYEYVIKKFIGNYQFFFQLKYFQELSNISKMASV